MVVDTSAVMPEARIQGSRVPAGLLPTSAPPSRSGWAGRCRCGRCRASASPRRWSRAAPVRLPPRSTLTLAAVDRLVAEGELALILDNYR